MACGVSPVAMFCNKYWISMIFALLSQNSVVRIHALFPPIFLVWKAKSADISPFWMYGKMSSHYDQQKCPVFMISKISSHHDQQNVQSSWSAKYPIIMISKNVQSLWSARANPVPDKKSCKAGDAKNCRFLNGGTQQHWKQCFCLKINLIKDAKNENVKRTNKCPPKNF